MVPVVVCGKLIFKDIARRFVGQRIVPEPDDIHLNSVVEIRLLRDEDLEQDRRWIEFRTESNLVCNERVAFDLLHFFSHIDDTGIDDVVAGSHRLLKHPLNPFIFELLNADRKCAGEEPFRIYARRFTVNSTVRPTRAQIEEIRGVWRGVFGSPRPQLSLWGGYGSEYQWEWDARSCTWILARI